MSSIDAQPNPEMAAFGYDVIKKSQESGKAIVDTDTSWDVLRSYLISSKFHIIALRGAGSVNGMDKSEVDTLIETELKSRIVKLRETGEKVAIFYDGDTDVMDKPDIGYVAGRLLDEFGNDPKAMMFLAAQKKSWYSPKQEGGNITNANDKGFVTYVFEDKKYEGDHNSFTQDKALITGASQYEQWYIGASGEIATKQLKDFDAKVSDGETRKAIIFRVRNNGLLDNEIATKMQTALDNGDYMKADKLKKQLDQRKNVYGTHWDNEGNPTIHQDMFPRLQLEYVSK